MTTTVGLASEKRRVACAFLALRAADALHIALTSTPLLQLLESNVCRNYYREHNGDVVVASDGNIADELCKVAEVQSDISYLNGAAALLNLVPALIAALLYFGLSQFVSKKTILLANVTGSLMMILYYMAILYFYNTFDQRWMWLSGLFNLIGGGELVFVALLQALIAETIPNESLSAFYQYSTATSLIANVIGSASSLAMMKSSVWLPVIMGAVIKSLGIPMVSFLLDRNEIGSTSETTGFHPLPTEDQERETGPEAEPDMERPSYQPKQMRQQVTALWITLRGCLFPLAVCGLQELGNTFRTIIPYWLSMQYSWSLREVGYISLGEMLLAALVISLLPRLPGWMLPKRGGRGGAGTERSMKGSRDLGLAKLCLSLACIGTALLGIKWSRASAIVSLIVLAAGTGFHGAYLSHVTANLQKQEIVTVCMVLSMAAFLSFSAGASLVGGLYSLCLQLDHSWATSLPIWLCSLAFAMTVVLLHRSA